MTQQIKVSDTSYDGIQESIKTFFRGESDYTGFDFDGSALSLITKVLAYATYYDMFYANAVANESFLQTAQVESNVYRKALEFGYLPRSIKSATIEATVTNTSGSQVVLTPNESTFNTVFDNVTYVFTPTEQVIIDNGSSESVTMREGTINSQTYVYNASVFDQRFVIPDTNVDTDSIVVYTQATLEGSKTYYEYAANLLDVDSSSSAFFLDMDSGLYKVYFGDGVIGSSPSNNEFVTISYQSSNGEDANGISTLSGDSGLSVMVTSNSSGGTDKESVSSVRFNAANAFSAQNRAVTESDYKTIIGNVYSNIETIKVWGGQDNVPAKYGRVFVSIKPNGRNDLTDAEKGIITTELSKKAMLGIDIEYTDPEYIGVDVVLNLKVDGSLSKNSRSSILSSAELAATNYGDNTLEKFDADLIYSDLLEAVRNSDTGITSAIASLVLSKTIELDFTNPTTYTTYFGTEIYRYGENDSVYTDTFSYLDSTGSYVTSYIRDNGGILEIVSNDGDSTKTLFDNIGTVDYTNGIVVIRDFTDKALSQDEIKLYVVPGNNGVSDVSPVNNQLLQISDVSIVASSA